MSSKADFKRLGYIGFDVSDSNERDSDSWYTPSKYVESARRVFGGEISLDPFSSEKANQTIKAAVFYTIDDDALGKDWITTGSKTVWMNPPYGKSMGAAVKKFCQEYVKSNFVEAIVLCNNATDTKWFTDLAKYAKAFCFTDHRISFEQYDGKHVSGNTRGQIFCYFGNNLSVFASEFSKYGLILTKNLA